MRISQQSVKRCAGGAQAGSARRTVECVVGGAPPGPIHFRHGIEYFTAIAHGRALPNV